MRNDGIGNAKLIALNGILTAINVIILFLATVAPTGRLSLYALSSFLTAIIVIEFGNHTAFVFFLVTGLLSFFVIPDKTGIVPYIVFFGFYGILKSYIEKIGRFVPEYLLKLASFNILVLIAFVFIKKFFFENIPVGYPVWFLAAALEIVFIIYDYVYSLFIQYYLNRIRNILKF